MPNTAEAGIPPCLQFRGNQSLVGVDGLVPTSGKSSLVSGLLQFHRKRLKAIRSLPIDLLDRLKSCINCVRLDNLEDGSRDGLFWSPFLDGEISPLGPLAAAAAAEGYGKRERSPGDGPQPFHGYFFKILTRQGKHTPGGKYEYVINGNMIGGFALVAWPVEYGESGVMTFVVNQRGRVYQKDLGPDTAKTAEVMKAYDPDKTWSVSPD